MQYEIRQAAREAGNAADDTERHASTINKELDHVLKDWTGEAADALRSERETVSGMMRNQKKNLENLEKRLKKLADEVQKAEAERERQRLLAEQQMIRDFWLSSR
jgi:WXG100 family type VII secretion target